MNQAACDACLVASSAVARLETINCIVCGKTKQSIRGPGERHNAGYVCGACYKEAEDQQLEAKLAELRAMPVEERLSRIERWIETYKPPESIKDMLF